MSPCPTGIDARVFIDTTYYVNDDMRLSVRNRPLHGYSINTPQPMASILLQVGVPCSCAKFGANPSSGEGDLLINGL